MGLFEFMWQKYGRPLVISGAAAATGILIGRLAPAGTRAVTVVCLASVTTVVAMSIAESVVDALMPPEGQHSIWQAPDPGPAPIPPAPILPASAGWDQGQGLRNDTHSSVEGQATSHPPSLTSSDSGAMGEGTPTDQQVSESVLDPSPPGSPLRANVMRPDLR